MTFFPFRVRFSKTGRLRFLSHHDLMRLFERALRRSGLPLRMTEGYNPHPVVSFPTALGLGLESVDEVLEFELTSWTAPRQIEKLLGEQLPEGIGIVSAETFDRKARSCVAYVEYEATCPGQGARMPEGIRAFLELKTCPVERPSDKGSKTVEIRQHALAVESDGDRAFLRIKVTDQGTAKPEEILRAIGVTVGPAVRIRKSYSEVGTRP